MTALQPFNAVPTAYSREWVDLVKQNVAKGATETQLQMFLYQCQKTGLDPLARQIYFQKRRTKNGEQMTILTGIDGYRLTAQRTGEYAGSDDAVYDSEDNPRRATVTVFRLVKGIRCPFTATARWDQYYPGDAQGFMWKKMPHLMLAKCAEALALRKAFPQEPSGIYTPEEMEQAGPPIEAQEAATAQPKAIEAVVVPKVPPIRKREIYTATPEQVDALNAFLQREGVPSEYWAEIEGRLMDKDKSEIHGILVDVRNAVAEAN
jgi:phage recombination protein Bet